MDAPRERKQLICPDLFFSLSLSLLSSITPLGFLGGLEGQHTGSEGDDQFIGAVALWEPPGYFEVKTPV